ncbi:hypothetical protein BCR34DRAFT_335326 [Clohesyomyces aquaticus]|uniref:Zn(2)-C6 fungal-type domain-containing protein n=1 Tax=Clohesyomyces aquaticus TaxID=1231657 RepID=A0A1Y1ZLF3_9PLEO|nr:hypothetical protein BCR34DRAFT_335326 [Clohesyomyces aquaticus]
MAKDAPRRKTHTKSRKGCFQCKQRHTKCDETHPRCSNCRRLDIDCTWPTRPSTTLSHSPASALRTPQANSPDLAYHIGDSDLQIDDMRLLHHWNTKMYRSMDPKDGTGERMWQIEFTELGFDHPFLLRGFLALAAIHKAIGGPQSEVQGLLHQADSHMSKSLVTYRKHLEQPNPETAVPMFLFSTMLVIHHLGSEHLQAPGNPIDSIHHCFRLLQGVKVVIEPHSEVIRNSEVFAVISKSVGEYWDWTPNPGDRCEEILSLQELANGMEAADREAIVESVNELHKIFLKLDGCSEDIDEHAIMFIWPSVVPENFLNLLCVHNHIAVVILAHFAACFSRTRHPWWVHDWPQRILHASDEVLENDPELRGWLAWPTKQILGNTA